MVKLDQSVIMFISAVIITALVLLVYSCTCTSTEDFKVTGSEQLDPFGYFKSNESKDVELSVQTVQSDNMSQGILSSGTVSKFKLPQGVFEYHYTFNLPLSYGGDFIPGQKEYTVKAGTKKDMLASIGTLTRGSDGYYRLFLLTPEDYTFTEISLGSTVVFKSPIRAS
jgi:hypothetical protein